MHAGRMTCLANMNLMGESANAIVSPKSGICNNGPGIGAKEIAARMSAQQKKQHAPAINHVHGAISIVEAAKGLSVRPKRDYAKR